VLLVLFQGDNYGFSVPVVFRSKAQCEANGRSLGRAGGDYLARCEVAFTHFSTDVSQDLMVDSIHC
jgi:hypothetical protein